MRGFFRTLGGLLAAALLVLFVWAELLLQHKNEIGQAVRLHEQMVIWESLLRNLPRLAAQRPGND